MFSQYQYPQVKNHQNRLKLDSIGIGLNASDPFASSYMNLNTSQYLIVGERFDSGFSPLRPGSAASNYYSFLVDSGGVAVNAQLQNHQRLATGAALFVDGNVYVTGTVTSLGGFAGSGGTSSTGTGGGSLWYLTSNAYERNSIFYDGAVTIGNNAQSQESRFSLLIDQAANYTLEDAQLSIRNDNNAQITIGILGCSNASPAVVQTPPGVGLHFLVGRSANDVNALYSSNFVTSETALNWTTDLYNLPRYDYINNTRNGIVWPAMQIDSDGNVGIHTSISRPLTFMAFANTGIQSTLTPGSQPPMASSQVTQTMILDVNGPMFAENLLMVDFNDGRIKSLDEIYYRKNGVSFPACNIMPGSFANGGFNFQTLGINTNPPLSNYVLDVNGNMQVSSNLYVRDSLKVQNEVFTQLLTANYGLIERDLEVKERLIVDGGMFVKMPVSSNAPTSNLFQTYIYGSNLDGAWSNVLWFDQSHNLLGSNLYIPGVNNDMYIANITYEGLSLREVKNDYFVNDPLFTEAAFTAVGQYQMGVITEGLGVYPEQIGNIIVTGIEFRDTASNVIGQTQPLYPFSVHILTTSSNVPGEDETRTSNITFTGTTCNYYEQVETRNVLNSNFVDNYFSWSSNVITTIGTITQGPFIEGVANIIDVELIHHEIQINHYVTNVEWYLDAALTDFWSSNLPFPRSFNFYGSNTICLLGGQYTVFSTSNVYYNDMVNIQFQVASPSYSNLNYIGAGLSTPGRFGIGISQNTLDAVNHQLTITKTDGTIFEIELMDKSDPLQAMYKGAFIGHQSVNNNNSADSGTLFFVTPSMTDPNYRLKSLVTRIPQNMYFLPGYDTFTGHVYNDTSLDPSLALMGDVNKFVGIHNKNPQYTLDVNGDIRFSGSLYSADKQIAFLQQVNYTYFPIISSNTYTQLYITGNETVKTKFIGMINGLSNFEQTTQFALDCNVQFYEKLSYSGAVYMNPDAPYIGFHTNADVNYGLTVKNGIKSMDGFFTENNLQLGEWYVPTLNAANQATSLVPLTSNLPLYTYSRVGIGCIDPIYNLQIRNPNSFMPTTLGLSASTDTTSFIFDMNNSFMWNTQANRKTNTYQINLSASSNSINNMNNISSDTMSNMSSNQAIVANFNFLTGSNGSYQVGINTTSATYSIGATSYSPACLVNGDLHVLGAINASAYMLSGTVVLDARTSNMKLNQSTVELQMSEDDVFIGGNTIYIQPNNCLAIGFNGTSETPDTAMAANDPMNASSLVLFDANVTYHPIAKFLTAAPSYYLEFGQSDVTNRIRFSAKNNSFAIINALSDVSQSDSAYINFQTSTSGNNTYYQTSLNTRVIYNTNAVFEVFDVTGGTNFPTISISTKVSSVNESPDSVPSLHFYKCLPTNGTGYSSDHVSWNIRGPVNAYNDKMSFVYNRTYTNFNSAMNYTTHGVPIELFTFANIRGTPCLGIGNTEPRYAIDIYSPNVAYGGIRMINDSLTAGPQLLFETKTEDPGYTVDNGTTATCDYSLYTSNSVFKLEQRKNNVTSPILSVSSNGQIYLGMTGDNNSIYNLEIKGILNVTESIYVGGHVAFTTSNSTTDNIVNGQNVLIVPNYADVTPFIYGIGAAPTATIGSVLIGSIGGNNTSSNLMMVENPILNDPSTTVFMTYANDCHIDLYSKPSAPTDSASLATETVARMGVIGGQLPTYANFTPPNLNSNSLYFEMRSMAKSPNFYVDHSHVPYETVMRFDRQNSSTTAVPVFEGQIFGNLNARTLSAERLTDGTAMMSGGTLQISRLETNASSGTRGYFDSSAIIGDSLSIHNSTGSLANLIVTSTGLDLCVNSNLLLGAASNRLDWFVPTFSQEALNLQSSNAIIFQNGMTLDQTSSNLSFTSISSGTSTTPLIIASDRLVAQVPLQLPRVESTLLTDSTGSFSLSNGLLTTSNALISVMHAPVVCTDFIYPLSSSNITLDNLVILNNLTVLGSNTIINSTTRNSHQLYVSNVGTSTAVIIDQENISWAIVDMRLQGQSQFIVNNAGTVAMGPTMNTINSAMKLHVAGSSLFNGPVFIPDTMVVNTLSNANSGLRIEGGQLTGVELISCSNLLSGSLQIHNGVLNSVAGLGIAAPSLGSNLVVGDYQPYTDLTAYLSSSAIPVSIVGPPLQSATYGQSKAGLSISRGDALGRSVHSSLAVAKTSINGLLGSRLDISVGETGTADNNVASFTYSGAQNQPLVGINNTNPQFTLDVKGDINVSGSYYHSGASVNMANSLIIDPGTIYLTNPTILLNGYVGIGITTVPANSSNIVLDTLATYPGQTLISRFQSRAAITTQRLQTASNILDIQLSPLGVSFGLSNTSTQMVQNGLFMGSNNTVAFGGLLAPSHTFEAQTSGLTPPSLGLVSSTGASSWSITSSNSSNFSIQNDNDGTSPLRVIGSDLVLTQQSLYLTPPALALTPKAGWSLSNAFSIDGSNGYALQMNYNGSNFVNFFGSVDPSSNVGGMAIGASSRKNGSLLTVNGSVAAASFNSFTGSHEVQFQNVDFTESMVGLLTYATGSYARPITIDTTIPIVKIANRRKDPRVYGAISHLIENRAYAHTILVNALGEGALWVCNIGGDIKNGDYLYCSSAPGYAMRQDDDVMHTYTVAKATQDVTFSRTDAISATIRKFRMVDPFDREVKDVLCALIGVSYHTA